MVLQFEDAVDVLKVMHPSYDFVFLFDHSAGHAKQRPDVPYALSNQLFKVNYYWCDNSSY
jgi:hypothetical protein